MSQGHGHRWGPVRSQPSPTDSELECAFYKLPQYLWLVQTRTQTQDYGECVPPAAAGPSVRSTQYLKQVQRQVQVRIQNAPLSSPVFKEDIPHTEQQASLALSSGFLSDDKNRSKFPVGSNTTSMPQGKGMTQ